MTAFFLQGYDGSDGQTVYWTWTDPSGRDHLWIQQRATVDAAIAELRAALPWEDPTLAQLDVTELNDHLAAADLPAPLVQRLGNLGEGPGRWQQDARMVLTFARVATGAMSDPATEHALALRLGQALVPPDLVEALRAEAAGGIPGEGGAPRLTVLPARSCSAAPWGWLGTDSSSDERLVELADVVTMGPALHRDGRAAVPHPAWSAHCDLPPLYVVDPSGPGIMSVLRCDAGVDQVRLWQSVIDAAGHTAVFAGADRLPGLVQSTAATRTWLAGELLGRSAVLFVGHVVAAPVPVQHAGDSGAGRVGLLLAPPLGERTPDTLTASDIVSSLIAPPTPAPGVDALPSSYAASARHTAESRLAGDATLATDAVLTPDAEPAADAPSPESAPSSSPAGSPPSRGYAASPDRPWRWPPRVGLVACQSGSDLSFAEPFGLVTAILEAGAELVIATLWPLFTDTMFALASGRPVDTFTPTPLFDLSLKTRDVLSSHTPIEDFSRWQRQRLVLWRAEPSLTTSPVTWAAATVHYAPDRTPRPTG